MTEFSSEAGGKSSTSVPDTVQLPNPDGYQITRTCTHEEFLSVVRVYARAVTNAATLSVSVTDLAWNVSTRAKRRAGATRYEHGKPQEVTLAWKQFENEGWTAVASTIRHELIHVHLLNEGVGAGHGEVFQRYANALDASVHCERFTEPTWWVICTNCGARLARYRRSKLVKTPSEYQCGDCGGDFRVESTER
jgi:predicted SprT family Zn-dependent metalloprotease